jgi:hypothetical protein
VRFVSAFKTFLGVMVLQFFALAITETVLGGMITPFGSRNVLLVVMLGVAFAAAILRFRSLGPAGAAGSAESSGGAQSFGTASSPESAQASRSSEAGARGHGAANAGATQRPPTGGSSASSAPAFDMDAAMAATLAAVKAKPPAPPADAPIAEMVLRAARQAIVFRQYFPPLHHRALRSFFGGAPVAPHGFAWPRFGSDNRPLHFFLQVDLTEVPASARLGALPDRGVLYFFLDLGTNGPAAARVIHDDARDGDWVEIQPPADLGPAFGEEATYAWAWSQSAEQSPVLLPKWPFEPIAIELPEPVLEEEDSSALWPGASLELQAAQGEVVPSHYFSITDLARGDSLIRPFDSFPHDWRAVQIFSAMLVREADRARRYPSMGAFRNLDAETRDARVQQTIGEAQSWFDRAIAEPPFDAVPRSDRDAFWTFLTGNAPLARSMVTNAMTLAIEASLAASAEAAARIPADVAERVRSRHALAVTTESGLHVNIPDRMLAPPIDVQGNVWERAKTHLLLLEFSSNEGLGHHFGEGVIQLWITPENFAAGRFDKVEMTADAY